MTDLRVDPDGGCETYGRTQALRPSSSLSTSMAADRKLLAAAFAAIAFLTAGPARGAVTRPTQTAPAAGAVVQFRPVVRLDAGRGRRQVRVPDQRRRRHELAGARRRQGRLLHAQHARDAEEDDPERHLLLARARDERRRRELEVDRAALLPEALEPAAGAADAELGRRAHLPRRSPSCSAGRGSRAPRTTSSRSRATRPSARSSSATPTRTIPKGPPNVAATLGRDHVGARARVVLLERHARRRRGQPRRLDAGRLVLLALADRHHDAASRT